jgi:hypothetical protein
MAERTGSLVFSVLWSYVLRIVKNIVYIGVSNSYVAMPEILEYRAPTLDYYGYYSF